MGLFAYIFAAAILCTSPITAIEPAQMVLTENERAYIQNLGPIDVAVDNNFTPLSQYDSDSRTYTGSSVELFETIAETIGLEYRYVMADASWEEKVTAVESGQIDLLFPVSNTNTRNEFGCYSDSYYTTYYALLARSDAPEINGLSEVCDASVGITKGASIASFMETVVEPGSIRFYQSDDKMYQALCRKEIDFGCQNLRVFTEDYYLKELFSLKAVYTISEFPRDYCYFFPKRYEDHILVDLFDRGIAVYNSEELLDKYALGQLEIMNRYIASLRQKNILYVLFGGASLALLALSVGYLWARQKQNELARTAKANELAFLRAQIKPHFLYNTLSAIAGLCCIDAQKASELTIKLSRYLRIIFETDNMAERIPIQQELDLIRLYLDIEQARHDERLYCEMTVTIEKAGDKYIIPLAIQPFVENAVKHGALKKNGGGWVDIRITEADGLLTAHVKDSGDGFLPPQAANLCGVEASKQHEGSLANVKKRLAAEGGEVTFERKQNFFEVTITIPIRERP